MMIITIQFKLVTGEIDEDNCETDDNDDDNDYDIITKMVTMTMMIMRMVTMTRIIIFTISQCRTRENTFVSSTTGSTQSG